MTIFLTGYMASGKTTLGRALARHLGVEFIDLDFYIEQRYRMKVPQIFAEKGEEGFRRLEAVILREAGEFENVVISCGGGTPCFGDNMEFMNSRGVTVFLDAPADVICRRLRLAPSKRPIVAKYTAEELPAFVKGHLASRLPHYEKSKIRFDCSDLESHAAIAAAVSRLLPLLRQNFAIQT